MAVARGLLVDSTSGPTWMFGTASEHAMLYQYNFNNATNTSCRNDSDGIPLLRFAPGLAQSPGPFNASVGLFPPTLCSQTQRAVPRAALCNFAWAVMMRENTNLTVAGAGLYSWFDSYLQECVDTQNCQQRLVLDAARQLGSLYLQSCHDRGGGDDQQRGRRRHRLCLNNTQAFGHPFWSAVAAYTDDAGQKSLTCTDDDTSDDCDVFWACDPSQTYATVDDLDAAVASYPEQCMPYYAVDTLYTVLNESMVNYTIANQDYDEYFGYYREYVRDMVPDAINAFMASSSPSQVEGGPGNKYFDCTCEGTGRPRHRSVRSGTLSSSAPMDSP